MKTGRRDSKESDVQMVEGSIPNHNDSISLVLSRFRSVGIGTEGTVALLGAHAVHSVGRLHCVNLVGRLYPTIDPTMEPSFGEYLRVQCPTPNPDLSYPRNGREMPMVLDNMYYKNLLKHRGLLLIDQALTSDPTTSPFVELMAANNSYFHERFASALLLLSENNPLTIDQGEIRKDCRFVNAD